MRGTLADARLAEREHRELSRFAPLCSLLLDALYDWTVRSTDIGVASSSMEWFSLPDRFDAALRSIGRGWPGPGPLARGMPPCASARHSFAEWHYGRLVGALAAAWAGLKETRPFLMERARTDEQPVVRSAALEAITRHYRSHPDTKPLVLDLARNDSDGNVRSGALWPLAHYFRNDPETKTLLLDLARTDHDEGVRRSALLRWAGAYRGRSDVVLLSRDLDGFDPGVDLHAPIDLDFVKEAAAKLGEVEKELRRAYEELAEEVPLRLAWRERCDSRS